MTSAKGLFATHHNQKLPSFDHIQTHPNSSSSSSENTLDLITPYKITLEWLDGSEVLDMMPNTAIDG